MWISNSIQDEVRHAVRVFYVPYAATLLWKEHRAKGEPLVFSGWYWAKGAREGGPFRSQSACYRDAWYRCCRDSPPPGVESDAKAYEKERSRQEALARARKPQRPRQRQREAGVAAHDDAARTAQ